MAACGSTVSHQTIRLWAEKFGRIFANQIRRRSSGRLSDEWHLDGAVTSMCGKKHWLWRAVDQDGFVLEVLLNSPPAVLPSVTYCYKVSAVAFCVAEGIPRFFRSSDIAWRTSSHGIYDECLNRRQRQRCSIMRSSLFSARSFMIISRLR